MQLIAYTAKIFSRHQFNTNINHIHTTYPTTVDTNTVIITQTNNKRHFNSIHTTNWSMHNVRNQHTLQTHNDRSHQNTQTWRDLHTCNDHVRHVPVYIFRHDYQFNDITITLFMNTTKRWLQQSIHSEHTHEAHEYINDTHTYRWQSSRDISKTIFGGMLATHNETIRTIDTHQIHTVTTDKDTNDQQQCLINT